MALRDVNALGPRAGHVQSLYWGVEAQLETAGITILRSLAFSSGISAHIGAAQPLKT